mgnify:CR=1 FL=1
MRLEEGGMGRMYRLLLIKVVMKHNYYAIIEV